MQYLTQINAFERWLENNHLSNMAQLLWYKLMYRFNRCGWTEWISVDNHRLMCAIGVMREATFWNIRNELVSQGLMEYQKGKRGVPGRYKMKILYPDPQRNMDLTFTGVTNLVNNTVNNSVNNPVNNSVNNTVAINRLRLRQRQKEEENSNEFPSSGSNDVSEPVISLVLKTGEEYLVRQAQVEQWKELYPSVDVVQELRLMKGWTDANPQKRKTKSGIVKFITGWLAREQKGGSIHECVQSNPAESSGTSQGNSHKYGNLL